MKKRLYFLTAILATTAALSLSSCLKDPRYVTFSQGGTITNFPLGGLNYFGADAITETPDTDANGTIVRQFTVEVASPTVPTTATTVKLSIDPSIVTSYNSTESAVTYLPLPTNAYVFTNTTVTIPAGQRTAVISVTFYKNLIDPTQSYMLPIKIASTTAGIISGNFSIHYYHFIGNDFAGAYDWHYTRYNSTDTTTAPTVNHADEGNTTIFPVTPTQFEVGSGYLYGARYEVTFTKTGTGAGATYSNFNVALNADDVASELTAYPVASGGPINVSFGPVFLPAGTSTLAGPYTYAQAVKLFRFEYQVSVSGTGSARTDIDQFTK